jgi:hypothetical protein
MRRRQTLASSAATDDALRTIVKEQNVSIILPTARRTAPMPRRTAPMPRTGTAIANRYRFVRPHHAAQQSGAAPGISPARL